MRDARITKRASFRRHWINDDFDLLELCKMFVLSSILGLKNILMATVCQENCQIPLKSLNVVEVLKRV